MNDPRKNRGYAKLLQYVASFCLLIFVIMIGYFHSTMGIDLTDEGMYVSTPMRYALGDIPFQDEIMNLVRPFDILMSSIFIINPDISLLYLRLSGLLLQVSSFVILFVTFSRFAPPILISLCFAAMFFLSDPYNIISPSYNTLSRDFSIISMALWLCSMITESRNSRLASAVLGGCFLSFAVICYYTQLILVLVPIFFIGCCLFSSLKENKGFVKSSSIFLISFLTVLSIIVTIAVLFWIPSDYLVWLKEITITNDVRFLGPYQKLLSVLNELMPLLPRSLILLAILSASIIIISRNFEKKVILILGLLSIILVPFAFIIILIKSSLTILLSFTFLLAFSLLLFTYACKLKEYDRHWIIIRNLTIAWGLLSVFIFSVSSGGALKNGLLGSSLLYVAVIISLYRIVNGNLLSVDNQMPRNVMMLGLICAVVASFIVSGVFHIYNYRYRDVVIEQLTSKFNHPKLSGIYSSPRKVEAIEGLLLYLKHRVKPGDLMLAYNNIPMLYFLTDTRPSYGAAWARDDWPLSVRKKLFDAMVSKKRIPEYCIRMLADPSGDDWNKGMKYDKNSFLDNYVNMNYQLEKVIYPFEILRYSKEPGLGKYNKIAPNYESSFSEWNGPNVIKAMQLSSVAPPLNIQGLRGDFDFIRITDEKSDFIRISPNINEKEWDIQFGYQSDNRGLKLKVTPGQTIVFVVKARCSKELNQNIELFIQDYGTSWERNVVSINQNEWKDYIVAKKIRPGVTEIGMGVGWKPNSHIEWLEIERTRVFIEK